jgi:hypothetical protein
MNSKNKNIRDLYRGINEFKRGYQPRSMRIVICLQIPTLFGICGRLLLTAFEYIYLGIGRADHSGLMV